MSAAALLLNGAVGAGKTTTAEAIGDLLREHRIPYAVLDLDRINDAWPPPDGDPFNLGLQVENLAALSASLLRRGATRLVLAGVAENADAVERYAGAVGVPLIVCRLRVSVVRMGDRLRERESGVALDRHLRRSLELAELLETADGDDLIIDVDDESPEEVARAVLGRVGWI